MDIAPTILDAMGIKFLSRNTKSKSINAGTKVGIGVSLLSDEQNLLSDLGFSAFLKELNQPSDFYNKLF